MKFEEFKVEKRVVHLFREEWGIGTVTYIYGDRSVLVRFSDGPSKHENNTNTFRYYEAGLKEFKEVKQ